MGGGGGRGQIVSFMHDKGENGYTSMFSVIFKKGSNIYDFLCPPMDTTVFQKGVYHVRNQSALIGVQARRKAKIKMVELLSLKVYLSP